MKKTRAVERAKAIVVDRSEEKEREYGDFAQGMREAARVATVMRGHVIDAEDVFACIIGMKLSREGHRHKEDNIVDAIAYLDQYNEQCESKQGRKSDDTR
jgi:hypothetical protein